MIDFFAFHTCQLSVYTWFQAAMVDSTKAEMQSHHMSLILNDSLVVVVKNFTWPGVGRIEGACGGLVLSRNNRHGTTI